jgi:cobyrinic acid a,c-diamide synthase
MSRTLGAIVKGLKDFDRDVDIVGVIANRVGSKAHLSLLQEMVPEVLGGFPKLKPNSTAILPERHLGLVWAFDQQVKDQTFEELSSLIGDYVDTDKLLDKARQQNRLGQMCNDSSSVKVR